MSAGEDASADARGPIPEPLKRFIWDIQSMVELADSEREILMIGGDLITRLIGCARWLPADFRAPDAGGARQFEIYRDAMQRFCVVSSVLDGGGALTVSQMGAWEIMAVVEGALTRDGRMLSAGAVTTVRTGQNEAVLHVDGAAGRAIVLHVYGGDVASLSRRPRGRDGEGAPAGYANAPDAPPYDIFSIQTHVPD